jgi:predicted PolB exonuclease-like 3'-5' exonuclease
MGEKIAEGKLVAFDLETICNPARLNLDEFVFEPPKNIKDHEKIAAREAEAKVKYVEKAGLNPFTNMIAVFGWCDGEDSGRILLANDTEEAERELLEKAWELLARYELFVTFNGNQFDVPLLNLHSLFLRVRKAVKIHTDRYRIFNHFDLRALLTGGDPYAPGKLDFFLSRCLGKKKAEGLEAGVVVDGSLAQHLWDMEMRDELGEYCEEDAIDTFNLFRFMREYQFISV